MKCPDCGIEIGGLPCWRCERESLDHEWEYKRLIKQFSLRRGPPADDASCASLDFALLCIQKRLARDRFRMTVPYLPQDLLRAETWWYIPYRWIGCKGFIVNAADGYVNWLGSALDLQDCFWGHERGVFCDVVDFTFAANTEAKVAVRILQHFRHLRPNEKGQSPREPAPYRDSEIASAMTAQFPTFRSHFVWYAIPALLKAWENEGLRFTCALPAENR